MPLNTRTDGSSNDRELTRAQAGKELSSWLLKLMGNLALPLASRSQIHVTMPPLAFRVWQQLDYLREKGSRLAGWLTDYAGVALIPPRVARLPILLPTFIPTLGKLVVHSPAWWRLLHLIWSRQRRRRNNQPLHGVPIAEEGQLISKNMGADELYPSELLQILHAPEEKRLVTAADELSSIVIKNLHLPLLVSTELPDTTDDLFSQPRAPFVYLQAEQLADELEAKDTGQSTAPYISQGKTPSIYRADQIQKPSYLHVKDAEDAPAQAHRQPQPTYRNRWLDKVWSPFAQRLVLSRASIKVPSHISRQSIRWVDTLPVWQRPYLTVTGEEAEPGSSITPQSILPYIGNIPRVVNLVGETIQPMESFSRPFDWGMGNTLPYSLPAQSEPPRLDTAPRRLVQPTKLKTGSSSKELRFNSPALSEKLVSDVLLTRVPLPQTPEISQARRSVPLVKPWPEIVRERTEATNVFEDSGSMTRSPFTVTLATPGNLSLNQAFQASEAEMPLIHRETLSFAGLRRQPLSVGESVYQIAASPLPQYFGSAISTLPPDKSEDYSFLWHRGYEPSFQGKDARQPVLEPMPTSVGEPSKGSKTTASGGSLLAIFAGTAYSRSQPALELAPVAAGRPAEAVSSSPSKAEARTEGTMIEDEEPDIDAIAHDVYRILRRRLATERERALGLG